MFSGTAQGRSALASLPTRYPVDLMMKGDAMLFVVSHPVIFETHRNGFKRQATVMLMADVSLILLSGTQSARTGANRHSSRWRWRWRWRWSG